MKKLKMEENQEEIFMDTPKFSRQGNFVVIFGSSGVGKSTMIKVREMKIEKNFKKF